VQRSILSQEKELVTEMDDAVNAVAVILDDVLRCVGSSRGVECVAYILVVFNHHGQHEQTDGGQVCVGTF
jgi:hypothetical protein